MQIELTPELDGFMEYAISKGLYLNREDAVSAALAMWEERARARLELIDELAAAERSIDAGEGIEINSDKELHSFFEGVKQRGRARLAQAK